MELFKKAIKTASEERNENEIPWNDPEKNPYLQGGFSEGTQKLLDYTQRVAPPTEAAERARGEIPEFVQKYFDTLDQLRNPSLPKALPQVENLDTEDVRVQHYANELWKKFPEHHELGREYFEQWVAKFLLKRGRK